MSKMAAVIDKPNTCLSCIFCKKECLYPHFCNSYKCMLNNHQLTYESAYYDISPSCPLIEIPDSNFFYRKE